MKTIKIFFLVILLSSSMAKAQVIKAELQVSGLTCALCAKSTEKSLKRLPFVSDIKPDLERNVFVITVKNGALVNFDDILKKVKDSGFFVNNLKVAFNFDQIKVSGNHFGYGDDTFQFINNSNKPLNGEVVVTLVDKGFAPKSVTAKYIGQFTDAPIKAGRLYHVAI